MIVGEGLCQRRHQMMFITRDQFDQLQKVPEKKSLIRKLLDRFTK